MEEKIIYQSSKDNKTRKISFVGKDGKEIINEEKPNFSPMNSVGWTPKSGRVQIYKIKEGEDPELLSESDNTATFSGRALNLRRMFNISDGPDLTPDRFIYWLGLGDGGVGNDPLDPIPPSASSTALATEIPLADNYATYSDYRTSDETGNLAYFKMPISASIEDDTNNYNERLIAKIEVNLPADVVRSDSFSEAGVFAASSTTGGPSGPNSDDGDFTLCARVTFLRVNKGLNETYRLIWWLRF